LPAVDLTQLGTVVATGLEVDPKTGKLIVVLPKGVTGVTTYDPKNGEAIRRYDASWHAISGTAGVEWQPDEQTLVYGTYSRGYRSGGFNVGIFTVQAPTPWTDKETVDSFEAGLKKTWAEWLVTNIAAFHYAYHNLQIPSTTVGTEGGIASGNVSQFINVPESISQGAELEAQLFPVENLAVIFNYSYDDAHITQGLAGGLPDPADPNAIAPGAKPLFTNDECAALYAANPLTAPCSPDIYTRGNGPNGVGWNIPQNMKGNALPNAAKNKIAVNVNYLWKTDFGLFTPSVSYIWRDSQYGTLFTRSYNKAPSWDEWDARVSFTPSDDSQWEVIAFGKNIFNKIGYDAGAVGHRLAGTIDNVFGQETNFVQGLNGPDGYGAVRGEDKFGHVKTYYITPPATYGIEIHYKF
jgi:iron complex outermembrane receptor protein